MTSLITKALVTCAATGLVTTPAMANSASELRFIQGQNYGQAYQAMERRGFVHIEDHRDKDSNVHTYWWNESKDDCVHLTVYRGNVVDVDDAKDRDCNKGGGGGTAAAVAGVAAVGILAALLSKKHHKKGKEYTGEAEVEFERGYRDGLHNSQYHNYNRSDAYSDGYTAGHEQRDANLGTKYNRYGYQQVARFTDLKDQRASSAMDQLERRGFRQVDNFTSGNTRYSIQWRSQSRQCVQATIADGRIYDIRDIQSHPKCRGG